ncbi:MAG: tRNA-dihydrouridine synthase [Patescibacteria group bacterium]|nr:tRNA-dihydrouridine synthase [Patescibacteria group bacterium]
MDDVTDTVFRQIVKRHSPADIMMTEFANTDGWCSAGKQAIYSRLRHIEDERPLIAQIWGANPEHYEIMSRDIVELGFDGIDINMGCPIKDVVKTGACSALIENHDLAAEIIQATKRGSGGNIPVSVKTRIGYNKIDTENWCSFLLSQGIDALTVHGRTKKDMSKVPANWDEIAKAVKLRDDISPQTVVIGNGDVLTIQQGIDRAKESGVDGVMIGRGIFQNFFVFAESQKDTDLDEMLAILKEHTSLHQQLLQGNRFEPLKKFIKMYVHGFKNAGTVRANLMDAKSHSELLDKIDKYIKSV